MLRCTYCGQEREPEDRYCTSCGRPILGSAERRGKRGLLWLAVGSATTALVASVLVLWYFAERDRSALLTVPPQPTPAASASSQPETSPLPASAPASRATPLPEEAPEATPEPRTLLVVRSNVSGDRVSIDGSEVGSSGPEGHEVEPGSHTVAVEKEGYETEHVEVSVAAGETKVVHVRLDATAAPTPLATEPAPAPTTVSAAPSPLFDRGVSPMDRSSRDTLHDLGVAIAANLKVFDLDEEELRILQEGLTDGVLGRAARVDPSGQQAKFQALAQQRQRGVRNAGQERDTLYALGFVLSNNLASFDLSEPELTILRSGLAEGVRGATWRIPVQSERTRRFQDLAQTRQRTASEREQGRSVSYLAAAAREPGAVRTASGLIFTELRAGSGRIPGPTDRVTVHYHGVLIDGAVFDSSRERGTPATFPLNGVIACWTEGVQKMREGGRARLVCPPHIAYGERGAPPKIKPGTTLIFDVELIEIAGG